MVWARAGTAMDKGACPPLSSLVIKSSSDCKPEPRSPAEDEKGFHGYHPEKENIQIKPESKVHPVSFRPKAGMQGWGWRRTPPLTGKAQEGGGGRPQGPQVGGLCPPSPLPRRGWSPGHQAGKAGWPVAAPPGPGLESCSRHVLLGSLLITRLCLRNEDGRSARPQVG